MFAIQTCKAKKRDLRCGAAFRLRCPVCALVQTPALHTDRGTRCALALSATGSARARDQIFTGLLKCG